MRLTQRKPTRRAQVRGRRFEGGRASVRRGSGASPRPKLANRWLNSESSTGSSAASEALGSFAPSRCGVVSGSGSLGIRRITSALSSVELRDCPLSPSRMEPQIWSWARSYERQWRSGQMPCDTCAYRKSDRHWTQPPGRRGVAAEPQRSRLHCHNLHGVKRRGISASKLWRASSGPARTGPG
jgi:hypothetical protein